jgi:hypothetical protein
MAWRKKDATGLQLVRCGRAQTTRPTHRSNLIWALIVDILGADAANPKFIAWEREAGPRRHLNRKQQELLLQESLRRLLCGRPALIRSRDVDRLINQPRTARGRKHRASSRSGRSYSS